MIFKIKYPSKFFGSRSKTEVYDKESLSCNGHSENNFLNWLQNTKLSCYSSYINI